MIYLESVYLEVVVYSLDLVLYESKSPILIRKFFDY